MDPVNEVLYIVLTMCGCYFVFKWLYKEPNSSSLNIEQKVDLHLIQIQYLQSLFPDLSQQIIANTLNSHNNSVELAMDALLSSRETHSGPDSGIFKTSSFELKKREMLEKARKYLYFNIQKVFK